MKLESGVGSYWYGFNGKEKDPEGMGGGSSTYDYGFRIYNPRLAKFLSVDPLTKDYPELTPYQFASNRPIDGIDLDGLEYSRVVSYNIASGTFNVQLNLKIKVTVDQELIQYANSNLLRSNSASSPYVSSNPGLDQYIDQSQTQYTQTVGGVYDPARKIQYSGTLTTDKNATIGLFLTLAFRTEGFLLIEGVSKPGFASVTAGTLNETTKEFKLNTPSETGVTTVHEVFHQGGVEHPTMNGNPSDVQLRHLVDRNYETTPETSADIYYNIMLYGFHNLNGSKVNSVRGSDENGNKATPGQMDVINKNIQQGNTNGL